MTTIFLVVHLKGSDQRTPDGWEARYGGIENEKSN